MVNFIISLIFGMLPEVIYFTLFLIIAKNLKEKKGKLFILLSIGYILLIMICRYQLLFYLAYIVYTYVIVKKLYKAHISDIFLITTAMFYQSLVAFMFYLFLFDYYIIYYIVARVFLFLPFIFRKNIRYLYIKYRDLWNRDNNKQNKIKSITLRDVSTVLFNIFIVLLSLFLLLCIEVYSK